MVEAIGSTIGKIAVSAPSKVARIESAPAVASATDTSGTAPTATVAKKLSAEPPVDVDRVRRIKQAVENGQFPISPAKIADRLIALRYEWMNNDKA
jgi:negative regulator of flagellin synthesis FlgM